MIILGSIFTAITWIFTICTMVGVDWILVSGINILPKAERERYRETHDVVAMNQFIGWRILLPISILLTIITFAYIIGGTFLTTAGFATVLAIFILITVILVFSGAVKLFGDFFEKKTH